MITFVIFVISYHIYSHKHTQYYIRLWWIKKFFLLLFFLHRKHLWQALFKHFSLHWEIVFTLKLRFCFSTIVKCSSLHVLICHDVVKCRFLPVACKPVLEIRIHFSALKKKPLKTGLSMVKHSTYQKPF